MSASIRQRTLRTLWSADSAIYPPGSLDAESDEFDGIALDSKWTWRNQGSATATVGGGRLKLTAPSSAAYNWRIIEQDKPATPYTVTARMTLETSLTNFCFGGFVIVNSSNGRIQTPIALSTDVGAYMNSLWTDVSTYNTTNSTYSANTWRFGWVWARFTDDGTNVTSQWSPDGVTFRTFDTYANSSWITSSDKIGLGINENNSGTSSLIVDYFRVT